MKRGGQMLLRIPACSQDSPVSNPQSSHFGYVVAVCFWTAFFFVPPPVTPLFPNPFVCVNKWRANKRDNPVHILSYLSCTLVHMRQVWMGQKPIKKKSFTKCHAFSLEVWLLREVLSHWVLQNTAHIQTASVNCEAGKIDPSNRKEQVKKMSLGSHLGADANISFWKCLFLFFFLGKNLWSSAVKQLEKFIPHYWLWHLIT